MTGLPTPAPSIIRDRNSSGSLEMEQFAIHDVIAVTAALRIPVSLWTLGYWVTASSTKYGVRGNAYAATIVQFLGQR